MLLTAEFRCHWKIIHLCAGAFNYAGLFRRDPHRLKTVISWLGRHHAALLRCLVLCLAQNLRVDDLVDREALHLLEVLADAIIMLTLQQVGQWHEWFALSWLSRWELDGLGYPLVAAIAWKKDASQFSPWFEQGITACHVEHSSVDALT